jgi:hypothetical protein
MHPDCCASSLPFCKPCKVMAARHNSWEARCFRFNVFVGTVAVATWLLVMTAGSAAVKPGEDFEALLAMLFGHAFRPFI